MQKHPVCFLIVSYAQRRLHTRVWSLPVYARTTLAPPSSLYRQSSTDRATGELRMASLMIQEDGEWLTCTHLSHWPFFCMQLAGQSGGRLTRVSRNVASNRHNPYSRTSTSGNEMLLRSMFLQVPKDYGRRGMPSTRVPTCGDEHREYTLYTGSRVDSDCSEET
jgi:hypothetical protein